MTKEPKISEIEKLINHFRKTNREDELFEVVNSHKSQAARNATEIIDPDTHEINEQGIVLEKIAKKEGLKVYHHKPLKKYHDFWKDNWIVRYSLYYVVIFIILIGILNAPMFVTMAQAPKTEKSKIISIQEIEKVAMAPSAPLDPGEVIPADSRLIIPKLSINAPVIFSATSTDEATIQADLTKGVAHYQNTAEPGQVGNSFITGHSSNFWWIKGNYNYIFVNLSKMVVGDQAKIYHKGNKFVYQVKEVKIVEPGDTSVLAQTDTPTLTLMTCTPTGTNWKRLIVSFDQVAPKYTKPRLVTKQVTANEGKLPSIDTNSIGGVFARIGDSIKNLLGL